MKLIPHFFLWIRNRSALLSDVRFHRSLLLLTLFIIPLAYFIKGALVDPEIRFLVPSWKAGWALCPQQEIVRSGNHPFFEDVAFANDFLLEDLPRTLTLRIRAFKEMEVLLNGKKLIPVRNVSNWKKRTVFNLAPFVQLGRNHLQVRVKNSTATPALLVESPDFLKTQGRWTAATGPPFTSFLPVARPGDHSPRPGPLQKWKGWSWANWLVLFWLAGVAAGGIWTIMRCGLKPNRAGRIPPPIPRWAVKGVPLVLLGLCFFLNWMNVSRFPYQKSTFDPKGHVNYVKRMATDLRPPLPTEGWEMYHPPLYYALAAQVYKYSQSWDSRIKPQDALKNVQVFSFFIGFGLAILCFFFARRAYPDNPPAQWIALGFGAFLPMSLYVNPLISNEAFSATLIACVIYFLFLWIEKKELSLRHAVFLGFLSGLALLSKYTALFAFLAGTASFGLRALSSRQKKAWMMLLVFLMLTLSVCGWFYARNWMIYKTPFIGNWDEGLSPYIRKPTFRSLDFYLGFGSVFFHTPKLAMWATGPDGIYASLWADAHLNLIKKDHPRLNSTLLLMSIMLILAAMPSMAIILGLGASALSVFRRPALNKDLVIVAVSIWTWIALAIYMLKNPVYTVSKAHYFLSLVPVLGVFLVRGRELLGLHARWLRFVLDGTLFVLIGLSIWIYRFPG